MKEWLIDKLFKMILFINNGKEYRYDLLDLTDDFIYGKGYCYVDQESYHVGKLCQTLGVEFISVRYMIDRCDRKAMPIGANHFWRKWQHKRMQLKFNKWLEGEK